MATVPTLNDILKTTYHDAVAHIETTPKFKELYQRFVRQLTINASKGSRTPFQMKVGYDMLHPLVDKLRADGLSVSCWNDTVEAQIRFGN